MRVLLAVVIAVFWVWLLFQFIGWIAGAFGLVPAIVAAVLIFRPRVRT